MPYVINRIKLTGLVLFMCMSILSSAQKITPVQKYGNLNIEGTLIKGSNNQIVQLSGMSLFWSQWIGKFYNYNCISWLASDWKCTVVRAAMAVGHDGYAKNPDRELEKIETVIKAAIDLGIYVVVDFHEHNAENYLPEARKFFAYIAQKYGDKPNVIYEIYNEPLKVSWSKVIKPYAEEVINVIREHDPDNIIVCGTPNWSQNVDEASEDPIIGNNIAYALHFYAGTHKEWLIEKAEKALSKNVCLFVTEYGTTEANGNGKVYYDETQKWFTWMDKHHISHCNWSVADKNESSAILIQGASPKGKWKESQISPSGKFIKAELQRKYSSVFGN